MRKFLVVLMVVCLNLVLWGCSSNSEVNLEDEVDLEESDSGYVGLSVEEATDLAAENGVMFRVVEEDGEFLPATMDFRPGRINATVVDGKVVSFEVEG